MNYRSTDCPDNLLQRLQNQWSDVEVRWSESSTKARRAHGDINIEELPPVAIFLILTLIRQSLSAPNIL